MLKTDCSCELCQSLCYNSPGWFGTIEEVEGAAKIMKMNVQGLAHEYLIREWWAGKDNISIPSPRKNFLKIHPDKKEQCELWAWHDEKRKNGKGFVKASWGHNLMAGWACIFLDDNNQCLIHQSKPTECQKGFGCKTSKRIIRKDLLTYWKKHQDWIERLV